LTRHCGDTVATPRQVWEEIWDRLHQGAASARDPFHLGVLATVVDGVPDQRTVVLRDVDAHRHQLTFHTDRRSPKVAALEAVPQASWLFYDADAKIQLRIACQAEVHSEGAFWQERWDASRQASRACYAHTAGPGTALEGPLDYGPMLPAPGETLVDEVTRPGRENFAVVTTVAHRIDWLALSSGGHRRLRFNVTALGFDSLWIAP
jgi:pyridoxamine 5'-phosphate oxidase